MTTTVLRPNATNTDSASWVRTGGSNKHGVTSDNSDSTYIEHSESAITSIVFGLGTHTLGTDVTKSVRVRLRGLVSNGGTETVRATLTVNGASIGDTLITINTGSLANYSGTRIALSASQTGVDGMTLTLRPVGSNGVVEDPLRVAEAYVDLVHAVRPTATVTFPTSSPTITTTNKLTATWSHTPGSDGGPQTHYELKVFTDAEIAGGGFDPDTTAVTVYESGEIASSVATHTTGALATGDTYGVYVRTAQTINGAKHWSDWDSETFTISVDTADVDSVTATAVDASAKITVTVARDTSSEAWDVIEVQRSTDSGTTWVDVRGATYVDATGDGDEFVIDDYETGNNESALYRARATRIVSELPITGEWVESSAASWESTSVWAKAPNDPTLNTAVVVSQFNTITRTRRQGVFQILGAAKPIVVSDVEGARVGYMQLLTSTLNERSTVLDLFAGSDVVLFQAPATLGFEDCYATIQRHSESRLAPNVNTAHRLVDIEYTEVDPPADPDAGI